MKIRRLEIQGFKSFADRMVLKFGEGITGVVGPNGCGKSNIVDAIRWVMGEQSAKHLRGMGMQDVIFAGCEARGPGGMAEVSITFKNDGALVPPEYQQMDEIQVTRRLFRDGTSEYAINQVNCRLRDILDLFMGTGIGKNAYAIIEQGRIGMIVTARPEERRALIEDAAGVSRYKARRKQAERRIAATEQNLLRVRDLVTELEGRLGTLEGQAEKAERYKALKTQLKDLDLHAAAHRHLELDARELFEQRRADELEAHVDEERTGVEADESAIEAELEALGEREETLREAEADAHDKQRQLGLAQQNVEFLLREDAKLEERIEEAETERAELHEEKARLQTERSELEALASSLGEGATSEARTLEAREVALEALGEEITSARRHLDDQKSSLVEGLTAVAQRKNALENIERRREDLDARAVTAEEDAKAARGRASDTTKRVKKLEDDLAKSRQLKLDLEEEQANEEKNLERLRSAESEVDEQLSESREKLLDRRSRLRNLEQIHSNYEGCSDAVRAVMTREQEGLHGLVAEVITADARYETAVEAVLGDRLQSVVVAEQQDGFEAVRYLQDANKGRSTFVPLDLRLDHAPWAPRALPAFADDDAISTTPPRQRALDGVAGVPSLAPGSAVTDAGPSTLPPAAALDAGAPTALPEPIDGPEGGAQTLSRLPEESELPVPEAADAISSAGSWLEEEETAWPDLSDPSVCGKMTDLVPAKPGYEQVAKALFGDVVVVEDLEKAHELWTNNGHRKTLVTLAGEVLDPMGLFTGGSSTGVSEGLLAQKREMEELRTEVARLDARVKAAETKKSDLRSKIVKLEARVKSLSQEGQQGALSIVSFERDVASLRDRIQAETDIAARAEEDAARLRKDLEALEGEQDATSEALSSLEKGREDAENKVGNAADALEALERKARDLNDEVTALKVDVAANREKRDSSHQNLARIEARLDGIEVRLDKLDALIERSRVERAEAGDRARDERAQIERLQTEVTAAAETVAKLREALEADKAQVKQQESEVRDRRGALDEVRGKLAKAEMAVREHQIARENLYGQIKERYQLELRDILTEFHVLPPQSADHVKLTKKLRRQLSDIGAINLTAIEEFHTVKARYDHLAGQKNDLEQAIAALRAAIDKINTTSRERYVEAFHLVNEKFQQVFPKVFAGGRCALVLTDEDDPLESGIEIMAQPPGKKLQSVNLLSGGEKALTAVSLIFGIFLIKPTPFCLLDEVDAPLDEANVGRYNEMLREMSPISQFVLITHNKRTMELPDRLYGVTMEIPGISKIVPVDVVSADAKPPRHLEAV